MRESIPIFIGARSAAIFIESPSEMRGFLFGDEYLRR